VRADSGFASPALYAFCEAEGLGYTIGLIPNPRLAALAAPLLAEATARQATSPDPTADKVRLAGEALYQADSWACERRVVYKAEALPQGRTLASSSPPAPMRRWPCTTGTSRGATRRTASRISSAPAMPDRLSCHRFLANQFRLLLHAAAYWLLDTLRRWLARAGAAPTQLDTLRLRLLKVGGRVYQRPDRIRVRLATAHPGQPLWTLLAHRPGRP
jgi:hypothetical protein